MKHFSRIACLAAGLALFCGINGALAQEYPSKQVRLIMPFPPGGGTDVVARSLATKLSERFGQSVVVEHRPGAGGNIAYEAVARSAPDGYTLLFATNGIATNASLYKQLTYDTLKDFAPITLLARSPHVLVANASVPANSVQELIALGKNKSAQFYFGSSGSGTVPHLAGELFSTKTGVKLVHVPYKGVAPAQTDLIGGSIQLMFSSIASALPFVKNGRLRALGVTGEQRSQAMPTVPTIAEAGVPGYGIEAWFAMLAPAGTPAPIVNRLHRELSTIMAEPELKKRMLDLGQELSPSSSPEEFGNFLRSEIKKMGDIVKTSGAIAN
jgi:tripartite-type tricarboxylate transporter receptor subunit TctC